MDSRSTKQCARKRPGKGPSLHRIPTCFDRPPMLRLRPAAPDSRGFSNFYNWGTGTGSERPWGPGLKKIGPDTEKQTPREGNPQRCAKEKPTPISQIFFSTCCPRPPYERSTTGRGSPPRTPRRNFKACFFRARPVRQFSALTPFAQLRVASASQSGAQPVARLRFVAARPCETLPPSGHASLCDFQRRRRRK